MNVRRDGSRLHDKASQWFSRSHAALLGVLPCRAGCARCCIGPFEITILDRQQVRRAMEDLPSDLRRRIEHRAAAQTSAMEAAWPRLAESPYVDEWKDDDVDQLLERFDDVACPALDETGRCLIYERRPLTCRLMGIPTTSSAGTVLPACEVQTALPIVRLGDAFRKEMEDLSTQEAAVMARRQGMRSATGEEMLLPYAFLPLIHNGRHLG